MYKIFNNKSVGSLIALSLVMSFSTNSWADPLTTREREASIAKLQIPETAKERAWNRLLLHKEEFLQLFDKEFEVVKISEELREKQAEIERKQALLNSSEVKIPNLEREKVPVVELIAALEKSKKELKTKPEKDRLAIRAGKSGAGYVGPRKLRGFCDWGYRFGYSRWDTLTGCCPGGYATRQIRGVFNKTEGSGGCSRF